MLRRYDDEALCREAAADDCVENASQGVEFVDIERCTNFMATAACGDVLDDSSGSCDLAPGKAAEGESCASSRACASGVCRFSGDPCGECVKAAGEGEPCDPECGTGLTCTLQDVCAPVVKNDIGGDCAAPPTTCRSFLICDNTTMKCAALAQEGEPCGSGCDTFLLCEMDRCVPSDLSALGEPCGLPFPRCSDQAYCDPTDLVCVPRKTAGEQCTGDDPVKGDDCGPRLGCIEGTCQSYEQRCG